MIFHGHHGHTMIHKTSAVETIGQAVVRGNWHEKRDLIRYIMFH